MVKLVIRDNICHYHHTHLLGSKSQIEMIVVNYFLMFDQHSPAVPCTSLGAGDSYVLVLPYSQSSALCLAYHRCFTNKKI